MLLCLMAVRLISCTIVSNNKQNFIVTSMPKSKVRTNPVTIFDICTIKQYCYCGYCAKLIVIIQFNVMYSKIDFLSRESKSKVSLEK